MLDKIKNRLKELNWARYRDVRVLGQAIFVVLVLMVSWSGIKVIQTNYDLQKQISALEQQNNVQKLENDNLSLTNQYYNTNAYLELQARQLFGKAAPGETEMLVPKSVALAHTVNLDNQKTNQASPAPESKSEQNFRAWMNFFMHRQGS